MENIWSREGTSISWLPERDIAPEGKIGTLVKICSSERCLYLKGAQVKQRENARGWGQFNLRIPGVTEGVGTHEPVESPNGGAGKLITLSKLRKGLSV